MEYEYWQWAMFAAAAFIIGMSKCGIPGLAILNVALLQNALMAKEAVGFGLPLLVVGDICAVVAYRKHVEWKEVFRLCPWTAIGVVAGYFALASIGDEAARRIIAFLLAAMLLLHWLRQRQLKGQLERLPVGIGAAVAAGILAGFISMVANAAGPVMVIYLLSMRLPKMAFMGVSVYFFTLLNLFKVPFLAHLDLITIDSVAANLKLAPFVVAGCLVGYACAKKISQTWFDRSAIALTVAAVARMLWQSFG